MAAPGSYRAVSEEEGALRAKLDRLTVGDHGPVYGPCPRLPDHAAQKAKDELNETPERRAAAPGELRALVEAPPRAGDPLDRLVLERFGGQLADAGDDALMLRFLRARKFDVARAHELMRGYVRFRRDYPELFENLTPEAVRSTVEAGYPTVLPHRDRRGRVVLLFDVDSWDPEEVTFDEILRAYCVVLETLLENQETQVHGLVLVENFRGFSARHAAAIKPAELKKMVDMLQDSFPARFKAVHVTHQPWYFTTTYNVVKPLMKAKLLDRVFVHGEELGAYLEDLGGAGVLPPDFDGTAPPLDRAAAAGRLFGAEDTAL